MVFFTSLLSHWICCQVEEWWLIVSQVRVMWWWEDTTRRSFDVCGLVEQIRSLRFNHRDEKTYISLVVLYRIQGSTGSVTQRKSNDATCLLLSYNSSWIACSSPKIGKGGHLLPYMTFLRWSHPPSHFVRLVKSGALRWGETEEQATVIIKKR